MFESTVHSKEKPKRQCPLRGLHPVGRTGVWAERPQLGAGAQTACARGSWAALGPSSARASQRQVPLPHSVTLHSHTPSPHAGRRTGAADERALCSGSGIRCHELSRSPFLHSVIREREDRVLHRQIYTLLSGISCTFAQGMGYLMSTKKLKAPRGNLLFLASDNKYCKRIFFSYIFNV